MTDPSEAYDLVVVGGGVVGASTAYHAVRKGARTLLVDAGHVGQASAAGAGIISAAASVASGSLGDGSAARARARLAAAAVESYEPLVDEISAHGDTGYERCGLLLVARDDDEAAFLEASFRPADSAPDGAGFQRIEVGQTIDRFPVLAPVSAALWSPGVARVDGRKLRDTLITAARAEGVHVLEGRAQRLLHVRGRLEGVELDDGSVVRGPVVVAGGAWTARLLEPLGIPVDVEPQRGQIVHFELPGRETRDWPIVETLSSYYLVAWPGGRVVCGATRETGTGFDPRVTSAGLSEVLDQAVTLAPALADATVVETRVGLRPLAHTGRPTLGRAHVEGLFIATGHGASGLTLGPFSARCVAELALDGSSSFDLSPWSPTAESRGGAPAQALTR